VDQFNIHEAKTQLSKLLKRVQAGETIIIAKNGKPVVELRPLSKTEPSSPSQIPTRRRVAGIDKREVFIGDDFDDPLPEFEEYM